MGERDEINGTEFGLKRDYRTIENLPSGTHPGAEYGAMRGSLMMGMVPGMLDQLRLRQSADGKDAKHQEDRREFEDCVFHQKTTQCDSVKILMDTHEACQAGDSTRKDAQKSRQQGRSEQRGEAYASVRRAL
jgi:hypothetical protein